MEKNRIKISRKMISLLVAGGIVLTPLNAALAKTYTEGKVVSLNEEEDQEAISYEYVAIEGDNLSRISEKICVFFGEEKSTKYWPALAFLNDYPRVLRPGDIIYFPKSFESLELLNNTLRKNGWTARYIQKNDIYGNTRNYKIQIDTIYALLDEIYGDEACVDEDFVRKYLDIHGLDGHYELLDEAEYDPDVFYILTQWIPSADEVMTNEDDIQVPVK